MITESESDVDGEMTAVNTDGENSAQVEWITTTRRICRTRANL